MDTVSNAGNSAPRPALELGLFCRNQRIADSVFPDILKFYIGGDDYILNVLGESVRIFLCVSWDIWYFVCMVTSAKVCNRY